MMGLLLLCSLVQGALADDPSYRQAMKHYEAFEFEDAARLLEHLTDSASLSRTERAQVYQRLGVVRATLLDESGATAAFRTAQELEPGLAPPADASPKIRALYLHARPEKKPDKKLADKKLPDKKLPEAPSVESQPKEPAPVDAPPSTAREAPPLGVWTTTGIIGLALGGAAILGGGGSWWWGLKALDDARQLKFQDDAAKAQEAAIPWQVAGQAAVAAGGALVVAGAVSMIVGMSAESAVEP